jgi:hypothetical protein
MIILNNNIAKTVTPSEFNIQKIQINNKIIEFFSHFKNLFILIFLYITKYIFISLIF